MNKKIMILIRAEIIVNLHDFIFMVFDLLYTQFDLIKLLTSFLEPNKALIENLKVSLTVKRLYQLVGFKREKFCQKLVQFKKDISITKSQLISKGKCAVFNSFIN